MPEQQPPKWAFWFLEKTCADQFLDELEGDLLELFDRDKEQFGLQKARKKFIWKALLSPRWYRLPGLGLFQNQVMHLNHFKVAFRHAFKHKSASLIQFLGLLLGLATTCYIGLFIKNELAYDHMHVNRDQLYRVLRFDPTSGKRNHATSSLHGATLAAEFPYVSMCRFGNDPVKMGEKSPVLIDDFYWSDSTFFELFTFPFIHGDPATCLTELNDLVITESLSRQLFGTDNTLGKTIKVKVYDGNQDFLMKITGVVKDPPRHSHIQFKALGAMANAENLYQSLLQQWGFLLAAHLHQGARPAHRGSRSGVAGTHQEVCGRGCFPKIRYGFSTVPESISLFTGHPQKHLRRQYPQPQKFLGPSAFLYCFCP